MVGEQQRLTETRLVDEYNRVIGNRKLGRSQHDAVCPKSPPVKSNGHTPPSTSSYSGQPSSTRLNPEMVSELNRILGHGHRLGIEFVDDRRFRNNSWSCYGTFEGNGADAIAALESCLAEHPRDYVRLVGVDSRDRRRVIETIVQRPDGKPA